MTIGVAFVTQWFPPEPAELPLWIAESLASREVAVHVLTGVPNYPDGVVVDGHRAWELKSETFKGLSVRRTPLYPSHDSSPWGRILNYLSWGASAMLAGGKAFQGADVALVYSSPATAALPAMWQRRRRGIPYVLMIQDLWPDSIFAAGFLQRPLVRRLAEPLVARFVQASYEAADQIVVIAPGMKRLLVDRGVPAAKIAVIYNWADETIFSPRKPDPSLRRDLGIPDEDFVLLYAGNHGPAQDLGAVIRAFELLGASSRCHLVLVGSGIEKERLQREAATIPNVHFLDPVAVAELPRLMGGSDAQLVSLRDDPLFRITMPSKLQAALASGSPVIVSAPGDAARVVLDAGAGMASTPGDSDDLARTVRTMAALSTEERDAMGIRAREYYDRQVSESVGGARLADVLSNAMRHRPRPPRRWFQTQAVRDQTGRSEQPEQSHSRRRVPRLPDPVSPISRRGSHERQQP